MHLRQKYALKNGAVRLELSNSQPNGVTFEYIFSAITALFFCALFVVLTCLALSEAKIGKTGTKRAFRHAVFEKGHSRIILGTMCCLGVLGGYSVVRYRHSSKQPDARQVYSVNQTNVSQSAGIARCT